MTGSDTLSSRELGGQEVQDMDPVWVIFAIAIVIVMVIAVKEFGRRR